MTQARDKGVKSDYAKAWAGIFPLRRHWKEGREEMREEGRKDSEPLEQQCWNFFLHVMLAAVAPL